MFFRRNSTSPTKENTNNVDNEEPLYHVYQVVDEPRDKVETQEITTTADNTDEGFREDWSRESNRCAGSEANNVIRHGCKDIVHKYEKVQHKKDVTLQSTNTASEEKVTQNVTHGGRINVVKSKRIEDIKFPERSGRDGTAGQKKQVEGYKVPPPLMGYEKMEWLGEPYVNREIGDITVQEAFCSDPSPYVNTKSSGRVTLDLAKGENMKNIKGNCVTPEESEMPKERNVMTTGENCMTSEEDINTRGADVKTTGENEKTRGEKGDPQGETVTTREDNKLIRVDGYSIPRPEGHYEEIKDNSD